MSSEIISFTLGLVTMATTLTKKYTIVMNFCSSKHNKSECLVFFVSVNFFLALQIKKL